MNSHPGAVAVTGASGYIGSRLLEELETDQEIPQVVAIDIRPLPLPFHNVASERLDITHSLHGAFRDHKVDRVVHLAFVSKPGRNRREIQSIREANLNGTKNVLKACHVSKVRNLVYLSTHTIYGAHKDNPIPITEDAPLRPPIDFQYSHDKALCEGMVREFAQETPEVNVSILRSCVVMGPGADNFVTRSFFRPLLLGVMGFDPPLQFVHEHDMAKLLHLVLMEPLKGVFNVAGLQVVHYTRMAHLARSKLVFLPSIMAYPLTQMTWKMGIQKSSPATGLDFIRYPMVLSTGKLKKETGFQFSYTSEEALMSYLHDPAAQPDSSHPR